MYYKFIKSTIPAALALLISFNISAAEDLSLKTVVIDAGHGGNDPGAVSRDRKTYEKTLTLDISKRLAEKISCRYPEVHVVLTRDKDCFVALEDRALKANKANANLFISIHINSTRSATPSGYSVHILGQSSVKNRDLFAYNMDVCKRENSVILLEDDYTTRYQGFDPSDPESFIFMQLMQNSNLEQSLDFAQTVSDNLKGGPIRDARGIWQNPFYVLWKTSMPAVLVELGFISNDGDLAALRKSDNRDRIAQRLFDAFCMYKTIYDASVSLGSDGAAAAGSDTVATPAKPADTKPEALFPAAAPSKPAVRYGTQIFASSKLLSENDSRFLGYKPVIVRSGSLYKYVIGVESDEAAAKRKSGEIRKRYPDGFFVEISGDSTVIKK